MMKKFGILAAAIVFLLCNRQLPASVVIVVGDGIAANNSFVAGGTGSVGIFAYNTSGTSISVTNFDLSFDLSETPDGYDGAGVPGNPRYFSGFVLTAPQLPAPAVNFNPNGTADDAPASGAPGHDLVLSNSAPSPGVTLAAGGTLSTAVRIGTLTFDIALYTPSGNFGLKFVPNATFDGSTPVNFMTTDPTLLAGTGTNRNQFSVTAVPEPATWALIGSSGVFFVSSYFRRRQQAKKKLVV